MRETHTSIYAGPILVVMDGPARLRIRDKELL